MVEVRLQCCAQPCDRAHQKTDVASRAQLNVRYVRAYTRKLTDPVLDADMSVSCHLCVSAVVECLMVNKGVIGRTERYGCVNRGRMCVA